MWRSPYLEPATVFDGLTKLDKPDHLDYECPKCHGYGRWVLAFRPNSPGGNFHGNCGQCNGWGWVNIRDVNCIHIWEEVSGKRAAELGVPHYGAFWHVLECEKCGVTTCYDSSG